MRTRKWWVEQIWIGSIVIATHLLMALALNRFLRLDLPAASAREDEALQVVFVSPPRDTRARPPAASSARAAPTSTAAPAPRPTRALPAPAATPAVVATPEPLAGRPLSAVYVQQAGRLRERPPPGLEPQADAFASRSPRLPGAGATLGVPMREPISAASVIEKVGSLFGGRSSPCPDNRKDIAALAVGGDRAALERAVDYERRYCRP